MKGRIEKVSCEDTMGSGLTGYLAVNPEELVRVFGEPDREPSIDGKVRFQWRLRLIIGNSKGIIFTIYDWKSDIPFVDYTDWHIGSRCNAIEIFALRQLFDRVLIGSEFVTRQEYADKMPDISVIFKNTNFGGS